MSTIEELAEVYAGLPAFSQEADVREGEAVAKAVGISAITEDGLVDFSSTDTVRFPPSWSVESAQIREGDVLLTSRGTSLRSAIARDVPPAIFASSNLYLIRPRGDRVLPEIVWACLTGFLNSNQQGHILRQSIGQVSLPVREIRALRFEVPPLSQQHEMAGLIRALMIARSTARATVDQYGTVLRTLTLAHFSPLS